MVGIATLFAAAALSTLAFFISPRLFLAVALPIGYGAPAVAAFCAARMVPRHRMLVGILMFVPATALQFAFGLLNEASGRSDRVGLQGRVVFAVIYAGLAALSCLVGTLIAHLACRLRRRAPA